MYNDIIEAIQKGLYNPQQKRGENEIFVVDTHSKGTFHMDISVAHHKDNRLLYFLLYFIKLKCQKTDWTHQRTADSFWTTSMPSIKSSLTGRNLLPSCPTLKNPGSTLQTILSTALLSIGNAHVNLWMRLSSLTNYQKLNT